MFKTVYMLVGTPAVGKTTFRQSKLSGFLTISNDDKIEEIARLFQTTYDDVWKDSISLVSRQNDNLIKKLTKRGESFVIDMTNLTRDSRKKKFDMLPGYTKIVFNFKPVDKEIIKERLAERSQYEGKTIPNDVLEKMANSYQEPSYDEGIHLIYEVDYDSKTGFVVTLKEK